MAVPEKIRKIARPTNTIVVERGNGPLRYAVVERVGCRRVDGRNVPVNGATVGHIIGGAFVEARSPVARRRVELRDYADVVLVDGVSRGLLVELMAVFSAVDAMRIYVIALIRVYRPGVRNCMLAHHYRLGWAGVLFPGLAMSDNSVSRFLQDVGSSYSLIVDFMRARVEAYSGGLIAIDGTLKTDNSCVNSLAHYSRKARTKGTADITVVFAFGVDEREPLCSKVFGGNVLDSVSYQRFLEENGVKRGVVVTDKGLSKKAAQRAFAASPDLHWLQPMKRNDARIARWGMYAWDGMLDDKSRDVLYKKVEVDGYWLYSFYDRRRAAREEADYFARAKGKQYDPKAREEKDQRFGTIVFESDLDADPAVIYRMYEERWLIEQCFRYYKNVTELDDTRVHSDQSVYGNEFVNFIASVMTSRLIKRLEETGLLSELTYNEVMARLASAKKVDTDGDGQWEYVQTTKATEETLIRLDLMPKPEQPPKRKPGRPRKEVDPNAPKRKPGRPRKNPS